MSSTALFALTMTRWPGFRKVWGKIRVRFIALTDPAAGDGVFSIETDGVIKLVDLKTNQTRVLLAQQDLRDQQGKELRWTKWKLSPDMKYVLVKTDHQKVRVIAQSAPNAFLTSIQQWRHSSFGNYYVHNLETKNTHPISPPTYPPTVAYATWSPTGETIAFVRENDIYLLLSPEYNVISLLPIHGD
jgi:dipeptidyl aminopeptidase